MTEFKDSLKGFALLIGLILLMAWPFLFLALTMYNS
jgi:hypothetical protein